VAQGLPQPSDGKQVQGDSHHQVTVSTHSQGLIRLLFVAGCLLAGCRVVLALDQASFQYSCPSSCSSLNGKTPRRFSLQQGMPASGVANLVPARLPQAAAHQHGTILPGSRDSPYEPAIVCPTHPMSPLVSGHAMLRPLLPSGADLENLTESAAWNEWMSL
jgi:hypothetical protein